MKKCPFCYEDIEDQAIKCKYCSEILDENSIINPKGRAKRMSLMNTKEFRTKFRGGKLFFYAFIILFLTGTCEILADEENVCEMPNNAETKNQRAINCPELKQNGIFEFPQKGANIICDNKDLRVSVWNNENYLYVQAVLWNDGDPSLIKSPRGGKIGDNSTLVLDIDADSKLTKYTDRKYSLNPWTELPGLYYQLCLGENSFTGLENDSKGRGSIRYIKISDEEKVRIDSFLIPLQEVKVSHGSTIKICYYGKSQKPGFSVNSVNGETDINYDIWRIPMEKYHVIQLAKDSSTQIQVNKIPEGRLDAIPDECKIKPMPAKGETAPEISAEHWINIQDIPNLKKFRGNIILLEFWATWCPPCKESIPHLNDLYNRFKDREFKIYSFTPEGLEIVSKFIQTTPIHYPVGIDTSEKTFRIYGVQSIPHAFLVDKDGKILWHGPPGKEMEQQILSALEGRRIE